MTHMGLFEGCGGFSLAAAHAGWETLAWCEINPFLQHVLKFYWPRAQGFADIKQSSFKDYAGRIDVLTGGFPCQPYSVAGKRKGNRDDRHLWPEMYRAIQEVKPRWIIGENVPGLINWEDGVVLNEVLSNLEAEGYKVWTFTLPACAVNAPHERERLWIVAHSDNDGCNGAQNGQGLDKGNDSKKTRQDETFKLEGCSIQGTAFAQDTNGSGLQEHDVSKNPNGTKFFNFHDHERPPDWERFPIESEICGRNDGIPHQLARITVSSRSGRRTLTPSQALQRIRYEAIKAYGNAIVWKVALNIFQAINEFEAITNDVRNQE